jgi:hypothetical protein
MPIVLAVPLKCSTTRLASKAELGYTGSGSSVRLFKGIEH